MEAGRRVSLSYECQRLQRANPCIDGIGFTETGLVILAERRPIGWPEQALAK
jgi:hypothetical protein